ncbi:MAG: tetratricopeptide repeat-containing glycosyltransferase family protein [Azospirillaceae bacterium]|nr:tetratricopeptide repeat-containing glycosyltransferase family protein [Azospirillaceae bacterium]
MAAAAFNTAVELFQGGRLAEAEALCRRQLLAQPPLASADLAGFLHILGLVAQGRGQTAIAVELMTEAARRAPDDAALHSNLGVALSALGKGAEAEVAYRRSIALSPAHVEAHNNLGNLLRARGDWTGAEAAYRTALGLRPTFADAHTNLGAVLNHRGDGAGAEAAYRRALALKPGNPDALYNLGNLQAGRGDLPAAVDSYRQALAAAPKMVGAHNNLGTALKALGDIDAAIASYRQALVLSPRYADAAYNLGLAWLTVGDYANGWPAHEARWATVDFRPHHRVLPQPLWQGQDLAGGTLLLHAEQGLGDTLQFCRYVPLVAARGIRVVLEVPGPLLRLLQASPALTTGGPVEIVAFGAPLPPFDAHCPLMSLPLALGTRVETIPAQVPYLHAPGPLGGSVADGTGARKVGLVWRGNPAYRTDRRRSLSADQMAALVADCPAVEFHSLQKDAEFLPAGVIDRMGGVDDFADTATLVQSLDLVISVDTSVAHLAGALGRPVWLLNRFDTDWRWLRDRDDSPWYPTLRQFRQTALDDWDDVITRVRAALTEWGANQA